MSGRGRVRRTYQTISLRRGRHSPADDAACVMELASMLAGDSFTDHPRSVSPLIAALLREYNDRIGEGRRESLYAYAARAVGTSASHEVERRRAERCLEWQRQERRRMPPLVRWVFRKPRRPGRLRSARFPQIGRETAHQVQRASDDSHGRLLGLVDELIAMGEPAGDAERPAREDAERPTGAETVERPTTAERPRTAAHA